MSSLHPRQDKFSCLGANPRKGDGYVVGLRSFINF